MSKRCSDLVRTRDKVTDQMISAYERERPEASLLLEQAMGLAELASNMRCPRTKRK